MQTLQDGLKKLEAADRRIERATQDVERQAQQVADIRRSGQDSANALRVLSVLQGTLATWCAHRVTIVRELERLAGEACGHKEASAGDVEAVRRIWIS